MVKVKDYVAGWLDSSIHDFLPVLPAASASARYALITCLDSNDEPRALLDKSPEFKRLAAQTKPLGKGLLLPTKSLAAADADGQVFFGFDEVWFFPGADIDPKPDSGSLVGPTRIDKRRLAALEEWMSANACSLALGDGEGLNFIVKAKGLVACLLAHSLDQPEPVVTPFETADSV
jgi:hypothetical protein